jgi:hypothetical protein
LALIRGAEPFELEPNTVRAVLDIDEKDGVLGVAQESLILVSKRSGFAFVLLARSDIPPAEEQPVDDVIIASIPNRGFDPAPRAVSMAKADLDCLGGSCRRASGLQRVGVSLPVVRMDELVCLLPINASGS